MADRYKLIKDGLVGPRSFDRRDLVATDMPTWNATTEKWDLITSAALGAPYLLVDGTRVATKLNIGADDPMTVNGAAITAQLQINSDTLAVQEIHTHNSTASYGGYLYLAKSRGTTAAPTAVASGDTLGGIAAVGYDGTDYATSSQIGFLVDATPGANDMPGRISFYTSQDGTQNLTEAWRINSSQQLAFVPATVTDRIALYNNDFSATMYGFGVESSTLYYRANGNHRWYLSTTADGGTSDYMQLNTTGLSLRTGAINSEASTMSWTVGGATGMTYTPAGGVLSIKDTSTAAPYIAMYNSSGTRIGFFQVSSATTYVANDNASSNVQLYAKDAGGTAYTFTWEGTNGQISAYGKLVAQTYDTWLRLNPTNAFSSGIYIANNIRSDGYYYFGASNAVNGTGTYGTINAATAASGWYGYAIANRIVFMHDGSSAMGLYNSTNGHWMLYGIQNGAMHLYHAGVDTVQTAASDLQVWNGSAFYSVFKGSKFKSGQLTNATSGTSAHGFGVIPTFFSVTLVCVTADKGYSVGDEVDFSATLTSGPTKGAYGADATNVFWSMANTTPVIMSKGSTTSSAITAASWKIVCKAWLFM